MDRSNLLALLTIGMLTGCGGPADETGFTVRDSAGVEIVTNVEPAWNTPWRVSAEPQLTLGAEEGEPAQEFTWILQALRLDDGRIVVADQQSMEIRYFENTGAFVRSVGGRGGGPGEFARLEAIARLPDDSLFAYGQWQATIFDPQGEFVRSFAVEPPETYMPMGPQGLFADGSFLMTRTGYRIADGRGPPASSDRSNRYFNTAPLEWPSASSARIPDGNSPSIPTVEGGASTEARGNLRGIRPSWPTKTVSMWRTTRRTRFRSTISAAHRSHSIAGSTNRSR